MWVRQKRLINSSTQLREGVNRVLDEVPEGPVAAREEDRIVPLRRHAGESHRVRHNLRNHAGSARGCTITRSCHLRHNLSDAGIS